MKLSILSSLASLAALASAQTPPGFVPAVTTKLEVIFGTKSVTPGLALTKAETARIPTIGMTTPLTGTYLFMVIGKDRLITRPILKNQHEATGPRPRIYGNTGCVPYRNGRDG